MPVWPTCFWSIWPRPPPPRRFPAPMMPMSFMVTPPSARAPETASDARSAMSLSGCLPNLVMWMPRIQMSSLMAVSSSGRFSADRLVAKADRLDAFFVGANRKRRQTKLHSERDLLGGGVNVHHVGPDGRAIDV